MKFFALAALALVAAQDDAAAAEAPACTETQCAVTDADGVTTCMEQADVEADETMTCDPAAEAEGSSALFASVATVAVAASMMM